MSAQPATAHGARVSRCCGRTIPAGETADAWARAELEHHGQPPEHVLDKVRAMGRRAGAR